MSAHLNKLKTGRIFLRCKKMCRRWRYFFQSKKFFYTWRYNFRDKLHYSMTLTTKKVIKQMDIRRQVKATFCHTLCTELWQPGTLVMTFIVASSQRITQLPTYFLSKVPTLICLTIFIFLLLFLFLPSTNRFLQLVNRVPNKLKIYMFAQN